MSEDYCHGWKWISTETQDYKDDLEISDGQDKVLTEIRAYLFLVKCHFVVVYFSFFCFILEMIPLISRVIDKIPFYENIYFSLIVIFTFLICHVIYILQWWQWTDIFKNLSTVKFHFVPILSKASTS